jgi:hypothetical protein
MMSCMSSELLHLIERLDSQQLRSSLAKLEQQRSALVVLLRAAVSRERSESRASRQEVSRGR